MHSNHQELAPIPALQMVPPYFQPPPDEEETEQDRFPLAQYLWILKRHRWRIVGFATASVIATLVVTARLTPIYEATATVDIDRQTPPGVVGDEAVRGAVNDSDQFLATQIKLVESDAVLRPVETRFHLREAEGQSAARSARGSEAPVVLKRLRVTRPPNTYLMQINYRSADPGIAADAANAIAQSYLEHTYEIRLRSSATLSRFMEQQLEELRAKMESSSRALAGFERDMNVVNPEARTNILGARLLQLNNEYTNAQSDRLKREAAFQSIRVSPLEAAVAAPQGDALRRLMEHRGEALEKFAEIRAHYGAQHPEYRKAQAQLEEIEKNAEAARRQIAQRLETEYEESRRREQMAGTAAAEAKTEFDRVNARSFEYQSLKREAEADKTLYDELVRKIKAAGINAGFQGNTARIADLARPGLKPVSPNFPLNALLALIFSLLLGYGGAVLADLLDKTVRDPDQVSRTLRAEVIGNLPLLKAGRPGLLEQWKERAGSEETDVTGFGESVRALRNSILLSDFDRRCRSLLVTSAAPGEGKTTTAANLAAAHAQQGKRTLLIDGDLRRPSVHRNFGLPSVVGFSNALLGEVGWRDAVIPLEGLANLHILPAGPPSRRASDLIGRGLTEVLEEASAEYDLVILDAPPMLGFAEPLQMSTAVDGVLVVARAGQTRRKALANVLATLHRLRARLVGVVLNEVHKELSDSYQYYGYYQAYYHPAPEEAPSYRANNAGARS